MIINYGRRNYVSSNIIDWAQEKKSPILQQHDASQTFIRPVSTGAGTIGTAVYLLVAVFDSIDRERCLSPAVDAGPGSDFNHNHR